MLQHGISAHLYDHHPALGRHQVLDSRSLSWLHHLEAAPLQPTLWEPKIPVLDQQNLLRQGIRTSQLSKAVPDLDALGSCTANAATAALSTLLTAEQCAAARLDVTDPVAAERWAIGLYAEATQRDEWLTRQWPSDDCGSSGLGAARALHDRGVITSYTHATNAHAIAGMLQRGPVLLGVPWFNAWFAPPVNGRLDEIPNWDTSGVAGGHAVCAIGLEAVEQDHAGRIVPERSVLRVRNSWGPSWGQDGDFLLPLSTYNLLRRQCDAIQLRNDAA